MGHQDNDLELRAIQKVTVGAPEPAAETPAPEDETPSTPVLMDHDEIAAWRKTARFFRKAA